MIPTFITTITSLDPNASRSLETLDFLLIDLTHCLGPLAGTIFVGLQFSRKPRDGLWSMVLLPVGQMGVSHGLPIPIHIHIKRGRSKECLKRKRAHPHTWIFQLPQQ